MKELEKYRADCIEHRLCTRWRDKWSSCHCLHDYMRLALENSSIEWICESYNKKWGLSSKFIEDKFSNFINGREQFTINGKEINYTSEMYVNFNDNIYTDVDVLCLINVNSIIHLPENAHMYIYITGDSHISLDVKGKYLIMVETYGDKAKVLSNNNPNICINEH